MHSILLALAILGQAPEGDLTIKTGDLVATMSSKAAWTITSITDGDDRLVLPMGGQGAVLSIRGDWIGSAMKEGSEPVASLTATADNQPVTLALPQTISGEKLTVAKASTLGPFKHTAETTFQKDTLVQHHSFEATDDGSVDHLYAFLYSMWPQAKHWLAQPLTGELLRGEFAADKGTKPNRPMRWLAQYDPALQKGVVACFREPLAGKGAYHGFWDTEGYHKLIARPACGVLVKGDKFDLTMAMRFFRAAPADWEKRAQAVAGELQQQVPPTAEPVGGQAPAAKLYGQDVPEEGILTLKTAKYSVPVCAEQAWTIRKIDYDGKTVAHEHGFYGTVLVPQGGAWWGTGHTEGGREIVHAIRLTADDKEQAVNVGETVAGRKLVLVKDSTIWKFKCRAELTVTDTHLAQRTQLEATEDVDLKLLYYFMHCFVPTTTRWIAELPDGDLVEGTLAGDGGFEVNKDTRWVAQFEPARTLGFLCYSPKVISGPGSASRIWDLARYHKFYYQANAQRSFKRGETLDYQVLVQVVPQETGDWSATKAAAEDLKRAFPPLP